MFFEHWFIKNEKLLQENSNVDDLLNRDSDIIKFSNRIDELHWSTIRWIVWQFWIWKSTLINNVRLHRNNEDHNERWFEFDARKYPDRKDLREWFFLDFAKQVDEKTFEKARKLIDGKQNDDKKTLLNLVWKVIPWWDAISELSYFFNTSPAKRVFEIQELFNKLIKKVKEDKIIIVIEDIDRSWDAGIFFLETLKQFITKNEFWKEILIIMPLWTDEYYSHLDSYLKPIDYFDFFNPWIPNLERFIKEIFIEEIISDKRSFQPLQEFLEWLFIYYPNEINFRKLKLIIRKSNQNHVMMFWKYDDLFELDRRLNIVFEVMKFIWFDDSKKSLFEQMRINKKESTIDRKSLIWAFIYNLVWLTNRNKWNRYYWDWNSLYENKPNSDWKLTKILKTENQLIIKFFNKTEESPKKEIIWRLYDNTNFETSGPYAYIVPYAYLDY